MKKKYVFALVLIGLMLTLTLTLGTGYGLYVSTSEAADEKTATTLNCFKAYFSHTSEIEMKNIDPILNEEGEESSPYTLTVTNICEAEKELQIRLNILDDTTVDTKALTITAAGNIEKETILYKNLQNAKTESKNVLQSKLIGKIKIKPNETIRTNIKLWFDEKKAPDIKSDEIFKAKFELIDTESSIKPSFAEQIINSEAQIEKKAKPIFSNAAYQAEGLFIQTTEEGNYYYYRGVVNNNYVKFANQNWRIVGINPDNSVKLILEKSAATMHYSDKTNAMDYAGLRYIYNNVTINNNVNTYLLNWYKTNITDRGFDKYVSTSVFCNDSSYFVSGYHTYFNGYTRLITKKEPTMTCPTTKADFGGEYSQKIGLITADEVAYAGGLYNTPNYNYYLYNGENFFTMTGAEFYNYNSYLFIVTNTGAINKAPTNYVYGIRPVINLAANLTVSGAGTQTNPYIIDTE